MKNKKSEKPECYRPNGYTYPLCCGAKSLQEFVDRGCAHCCLYRRDMINDGDYSRYDA